MLRTISTFIILAGISFTACKSVPEKVSKEEALATAKKLEAIVKDGNTEALTAFFDMPSLLERVTEKSEIAKDPTVMKGFKSTFTMKGFAEADIRAARSGSFLLLRSYEKDGHQRLLFRVLTATGITYQDFILIKIKNVVKAADVFNYSTGEELTTTLADAIDVMAPEGDLTKKEAPERVDSILRLKKLQQKGDYQGVKELYERLPVDMQETKGFLTVYIEACRVTDKAAHRAALEKLATLFPASPSAYLLLIDTHVEAQDYKKALWDIDKINELIGEGGDPYLDFYKGTISLKMEKPAAAKAYFEKVYAYDPELRSNLGALITAYVTDNEIDKAKKLVATYKTSKVFNQAELDQVYEQYPVLKD